MILTQNLLLTPQLQQSIKLLQLSKIELTGFINKQLAENPVLEEQAENTDVIENNTNKNQHSTEPREFVEKKITTQNKQMLSYNDNESPFNLENITSNPHTLSEHLLCQLGLLKLTKEEQKIAVFLVGNINDKGYLSSPLKDLAKKENTPLVKAIKILKKIQKLDPPGVGAQTLEECLLIQLREHNQDNSIINTILSKYMHQLMIKDYHHIAKSTGLRLSQVLKQISVIIGLEPNPGRPFHTNAVEYITPDVFIYRMAKKWLVTVNKEGIQNLQLNQKYIHLVTKLDNKKDKHYLEEQIKSASWLIKSLDHRQKTIVKVVECILKKQKKFFDKGMGHLKPLTQKVIAKEVSLHGSTISRVVSNKYAHTPYGLFQIKFFFGRSYIKQENTLLSAQSIKSMIKSYIDKEDSKHPFSDQQLVDFIEEKGLTVARRTVSKYRKQMGLLSSNKRKLFY